MNGYAPEYAITLVGCWAHARRKYVDALEENRTLATQAIHYIGKLYKIESEANEAGLTAEERKEKRISEAYPLIAYSGGYPFSISGDIRSLPS